MCSWSGHLVSQKEKEKRKKKKKKKKKEKGCKGVELLSFVPEKENSS